jgi:anti-repressor protein
MDAGQQFLCSHGERYNQPTQRAVEMGLFEMRKTTISVGDHSKVRTTTKVTGKGQIYFVNKFLYNNQNNSI